VSNPDHQKTAAILTSQFLHKASLLIPAEFAETETAAGRRERAAFSGRALKPVGLAYL
jgi:hypothetical protein